MQQHSVEVTILEYPQCLLIKQSFRSPAQSPNSFSALLALSPTPRPRIGTREEQKVWALSSCLERNQL